MNAPRRAAWILLVASCRGGVAAPDGAGDAAGPGGPGPGPGAGVDLTPPEGDCEVQTAIAPDEGAAHVAACAAVTYQTRPPASGTHYPRWPVFRVYDQPVPWGFLVHGLEHGAVVVAYHCPEGCAAEVEQRPGP